MSAWADRIRNAPTLQAKIKAFFGSRSKSISFIEWHWIYIISWSLVGSVLLYGERTMSYTDCLFTAVACATQSGLNIVNINDVSLYQQIVIYIVTCLCVPVFIHSWVVIIRLHWFEKHFDNINERSRMQSKMRRTLTQQTHNSHILGAQPEPKPNSIWSRIFQHRKSIVARDEDLDLELNPSRNRASATAKAPGSDSTTNVDSDTLLKKNSLSSSTSDDAVRATPHPAITFGDLPVPPHQNHDVQPQDMVKSLHLLSQRRPSAESAEGPALVIKSPLEQDTDSDSEPANQSTRVQEPPKPYHPVESSNRSPHSPSSSRDYHEIENSPSGVAFGALPVPPRKSGHHEVNPEDIHKSLSMLSSMQRRSSADDSYGPALVIKGPRDTDDDDRYDEKRGKRDSSDETEAADDNSLRRVKTDGAYSDNHLRVPQMRKSVTVENENRRNRRTESSNSLPRNRRRSSHHHEKHTGMSDPLSMLRSYTMDRAVDFGHKLHNHKDGPKMERTMSSQYLSWQPTVGRNSAFVGLSAEQKEELGGVEYRALKVLRLVLGCYWIGFHVLAIVMILPWGIRMRNYAEYIESCGVTTTWWGFFTAASAFNDLGYTLTPDSFNSFATAVYPLLVVCFFIVAGNTGFPIILRAIIWIMFKLSPMYGRLQESLGFLLDHPRRCFTLLFPNKATWWLLAVLIGLNASDLIFFCILDLRSTILFVKPDEPRGYRVVDGLFQAFSTRTAGFTCVNIADLHPGMQVSYLIMMYISVMPLAISIRRTNVYEEQSLGVYEEDDDDNNDGSARSYIGQHLRNQLSFDLWFIFLGLFIICIAEGHRLSDDEQAFNIFNVLFEIVSAYGTVGLSLGFPNTNTAFSAQFSVISKLIIIAMMLRGRHRGLPYALDRAITLSQKSMERHDTNMEMVRRRPSNASKAADDDDEDEPLATGHNQHQNRNGMRRRLSSSFFTGV